MKFIPYYSLLAVSLLFLSGCVGGANNEGTLAELNSKNIQRLVNMYYAFQSSHEWRGPDDEEEFKEFIKNYPKRKLERIGIDASQVDDLFINERDGEPFKVKYQVEGNMMGCSEAVVFEQTGVNGKKMIGFLDMVQEEFDDSDYEKIWAGEMQRASVEKARL